MPDPHSGEFTRVCSVCGRRVPRTVAACRCGAKLDQVEAGAAVGTSESTGSSSSDFAAGFRSALGVVIALGAIAFGMYWFNRPAPAPVFSPSVSAPSARGDRPTAERPPELPAPPPVEPPAAFKAPEPSPSEPAIPPLEDVIGRVMPAVVLIDSSAGRGSGFFVKPDTLLTNVHVVGSNSSVTVRRMDGTTVPARVEAKSPAFDIAVLKLSMPAANQATIDLGFDKTPRVGQEVIAIGSALGTLQNTVTRGIVSAVRQSGSATLVQTDAAVNPGNSGGPLLDRMGTAIGITTMGYTDRQGLNFAVGIEHARALLEGRPPSQSPATTTSNDLRDLSPAQPSETDRMRADGLRAYEQTLTELARRAQAYDDDWQLFRERCYSGTVTGVFDHEWFALLSDRALPGPVAPQCDNFFADFKRDAGVFRDAMLRADEAARRAGVYPGVLRETLRKHRLDYEGWNR